MDVANPASRWRIMRASVQGTSHAKTGQPCQDSSSVGENAPDGILVAAVADGAGSASLSDIGSSIAARTATQTAVRLARLHVSPFYEGVIKKVMESAVSAARAALKAEARRQERPLRDFATTLIVAICAPDMTAVAQIGDGATVTVAEVEGYELFITPQRGEYVNQTNFITSDNWRNTLDVRAQRGVRQPSGDVHGWHSIPRAERGIQQRAACAFLRPAVSLGGEAGRRTSRRRQSEGFPRFPQSNRPCG